MSWKPALGRAAIREAHVAADDSTAFPFLKLFALCFLHLLVVTERDSETWVCVCVLLCETKQEFYPREYLRVCFTQQD